MYLNYIYYLEKNKWKCFANGSTVLKKRCKGTHIFVNHQTFSIFFSNFAPKIDIYGDKNCRIYTECSDGEYVS